MVQIITGLLSTTAIAIIALSGLLTDPSKINSLKAQIADLKSELIATERRVQNNLASTEQKFGTALTDIPQVRAFFETSLQDSITSSQTTMTLVSATDKDGNALASSTYGFVIDEGTSLEELVMGSCTSTACSGLIRGLSTHTGTSSVTALQKAHRRGASVKMTDAPILLKLTKLASGSDEFPAALRYSSDVTSAQISADGGNLVNYTLLAATAIAGAVDASPTVKGIVELATGNEAASSTAIAGGDTSAGLALYTALTAQQPATSGYLIPVTRNNGTLDENFIATSAPYAWGGLHTFGADESLGFQGFGVGTSSPGTFNLLSVAGNTLLSGTTTVEALKIASTSPMIAYLTGNIVLPPLSGASAGQQLQLVDASTGETAWASASGGSIVSAIPKPIGTLASTTEQTNYAVNTTLAAGALLVPQPITVNKISFNVTTVATPGTVDVTVYSEDGATQEIAVTSGTIDEKGAYTISVSSVALLAGVHYFTINTNGTTNVNIESWSRNVASNALSQLTSEPVYQGSISISAGTPPATINPLTISTSTEDTSPVFRLDN